MKNPILYSFRRCPYAMRARMALRYSGQSVELREVELKDKPAAMIAISSKATVPVLQLPDGNVIDESLDIMHWALSISDPSGWSDIQNNELAQIGMDLINENDGCFKENLDRYKYPQRFPDRAGLDYRQQAEQYLQRLESLLAQHLFLLDDQVRLADVAIFPFIRQFSFVDREWFEQAPYSELRRWLAYFLDSELFVGIMPKYGRWHESDVPVIF